MGISIFTRYIIVMNLHEYQGKELLASFGVTVQRGIVAKTAEEAVAAGKKLTDADGSIMSKSLRGIFTEKLSHFLEK